MQATNYQSGYFSYHDEFIVNFDRCDDTRFLVFSNINTTEPKKYGLTLFDSNSSNKHDDWPD